MNYFTSNLRLNYKRFTPQGWKDIGIRKFEFVVKIQYFSRYFRLIEIKNIVLGIFLTLSLLGYLKPWIRWRGAIRPPPPLNLMFNVQI